jgi:transposase
MKEEEKWEIVHLHKSNSLSLRAIAKKTKHALSTVQHIISIYRSTGSVTPHKLSGRPSVMNADTLKSLDRLINKHDTAPSQVLANLLQQKTGRRVSSRTIQRARRGPLGRHPVHEIITKTLGEAEKERRVSFAQKLLAMNLHYVLWSDEKLWELDSTGQVHWVKKGAPRPTREVKVVTASVMVWGCVWYSGKSELCICEQNIDADYYIKILTDYLLPCMPESSRYKFQAIEAAWDSIPQSVIRSYIGHSNNVCRQIIEAGGDHI